MLYLVQSGQQKEWGVVKRSTRSTSFAPCVDGRSKRISLKMVPKCVTTKWRNKNIVKMLFILPRSFVLTVDTSCHLQVKLHCYRIYLKVILFKKKISHFYVQCKALWVLKCRMYFRASTC